MYGLPGECASVSVCERSRSRIDAFTNLVEIGGSIEREVGAMAVYEKEFLTHGLAGGNHVVWSLRFDSNTGVLTVCEVRTTPSSQFRNQQYTPGEFARKGRGSPARAFTTAFAEFLRSTGMKEIKLAQPKKSRAAA